MSVRILDVCFTFFQIFLLTGGAEFYESNKIANWDKAGEVCNVAIPRIQVTAKGFSVVSNFSLKYEETWIGLFKRPTAFEYIGCIKQGRQHFLKGIDAPYQYNTPGFCYMLCQGRETFGISMEKCFCFVEAENNTEDYCKYICGLKEQNQCNTKRYLSVYRVMENESNVRGNSCLRFERYGNRDMFVWIDCDQSFRTLCDNGNVTTSFGLIYSPWSESVGLCFQIGLRPASYKSLGRVKESKVEPSWLAVISSDVIYDYTEFKDSYTDIRYGYLSVDRSVHFTDNNEQKYILCNTTKLVTRSTLSTSARSKFISTTTSTVTNAARTGGQDTFASTSPEYTSNQDVIVISVSVSAVLVVLAVVAAFVFLMRRYKIQELFCRKTNKRKECSDADDIHDVSQRTVYENVKQSTDTVQSKDQEYCDLNDLKNDNCAHNYLVIGSLDSQSVFYENTE